MGREVAGGSSQGVADAEEAELLSGPRVLIKGLRGHLERRVIRDVQAGLIGAQHHVIRVEASLRERVSSAGAPRAVRIYGKNLNLRKRASVFADDGVLTIFGDINSGCADGGVVGAFGSQGSSRDSKGSDTGLRLAISGNERGSIRAHCQAVYGRRNRSVTCRVGKRERAIGINGKHTNVYGCRVAYKQQRAPCSKGRTQVGTGTRWIEIITYFLTI